MIRLPMGVQDVPVREPVRRLIVNGKFCYADALRNAFIRLMAKAKINSGRGFYCLRKTGASLIESIDPAATEMYLSHVENGMKKHYAERDWARLERALLVMADKLKGVLATQPGAGASSLTGFALQAFCGDGI